MRIFRRVTVAITVTMGLGLVALGMVHILGFMPQPEHIPELDGTALGRFRSLPNWQVGLFLTAAGFIMLLISSIPLAERSNQRNAKRVAWRITKDGWYVKGLMVGDMGTVLGLSSSEDFRQETILPFRPAHPDIKRLKSLTRLTFVRFSYADESPGEWGLDGEVSSYLRLKDATPCSR